MTKYSEPRQRLATLAKELAHKNRDFLERSKEAISELERGDFVWHCLLQSFATMGNSRGWNGLIDNRENYNKVTFDALAKLSPSQRLSVLERTLRDAKVRMPARKALWLDQNFDRILEMDGLTEANRALLRNSDRKAKIKFLKSFHGIGDKYSRNILMDVYHPDFRDSIAIDARIKAISQLLGLSFGSYEEHEQFYVNAAHDAGLNGWELDRLMWKFKDDFIRGLNLGRVAKGSTRYQSQLRKDTKCRTEAI